MKKILAGVIFILSLLLCFIFYGEIKVQDFDTEEQYLESLMEALRDRDMEGMYDLWVDKRKTEKNNEYFEYLFDLWDGQNWSDAEKIGEDIREAKGKTPSASIYHYIVQTGNGSVKVSFSVSDTSKYIDWMYITNKEENKEMLSNESSIKSIGW